MKKTASKKKSHLLLLCVLLELCIILSITVATQYNGFVYALFYNFLYGLIFSILLPMILLVGKDSPSSYGVKPLHMRQILILLVFWLFSLGAQIIPKITNGEAIGWSRLPIAILPLIMTTFFEEFLFRGVIQSRVEKSFGSIFALLLSAFSFSLYHLGYPGFRNLSDLILLSAVGLGFALSFKLSGNNLIVSYLVNLPNAFLTYILKTEQFPRMALDSVCYSIISITAAIFMFLFLFRPKREKKAVVSQ